MFRCVMNLIKMLPFVIFLFSLSGCQTPDSETPQFSVDIMTSATPGISDIVLTDSHTGWAQSACTSCHNDSVQHWLSEHECVTCHGQNGSPLRSLNHLDDSCLDCHSDSHRDQGFLADSGCRSCHGYVKTDGCTHREDYDVVIIGGGAGGLASAAVLAQAGKNVVLFEQHHKVGGMIFNFKRGDYRFEGTLHALSSAATNAMTHLGVGLRERISPIEFEMMYQIISPDYEIVIPADIDQYRDLIRGQFPEYSEELDEIFLSFIEMNDERYAGMSLMEALESHGIEDEQLISIFIILSYYMPSLPDQTPAEQFIGMWNSYTRGTYTYLVGGSETITFGLADIFEEFGGTIKLSTRVDQIVVENERAISVRTSDGGCYEADFFISNASIPSTYFNLIGEEHMPYDILQDIRGRQPAEAFTTVYLGIAHDYSEYFQNFHEIFVLEDYVFTQEEWTLLGCDPQRTPLVISNYSVADPQAAPEGKNVITLTTQLSYRCNNSWAWNESYESYINQRNHVMNVLIERAEEILPGLSQHIEVRDIGTPQAFERFTLNDEGTWNGFGEDEDVSRVETHSTPFSNLFFAGSWVGGGGISAAINSGRFSADMVLNRYRGE